MSQSDSKSGNNGVVRTPGDWDVETIIAQIRRDLNGNVSSSMIQEVLNEVIPKYKSARIQAFVPIFIHRDVVKLLKSMQVPVAAPVTTTYEAVEALVAANLIEGTVADDVVAAVLTAATNETVTE